MFTVKLSSTFSVLLLVVVAYLSVRSTAKHHQPKERAVVQSDLDADSFRRLADSYDTKVVKRLLDNYYVVERRNAEISDDVFERLSKNENIAWYEREEHLPYSKRGKVPLVPAFNDPLYAEQWYYQSEGQRGITEGSDHSIIDVWKMGFNGSGIKVVVIDDGFDHTHPDLHPNYNSTISKDLNEDDDDPYPRIPEDDREFNAHGTKCGGQIAAVPNNKICGVGIAHGAQIGGIKILDGRVTDSLEAEAFRHYCEDVDIYSMSWGPSDDGKTFGGFMKLSYEAVEYCINHGRGGLGSIYVWASGNGGSVGDCCSADSLVSSPFTVSIGALTHEGRPAYFQESCPSTIAAVYTGGVSREQMDVLMQGSRQEKSYPMVTTSIMFNKHNPQAAENCDEYFSGTSAAGPLGAGMIALLLQSNPLLTWRDVQHIIVETCDQPNPDDADAKREGGAWEFNGDGRTVSHDFGFGVMNAAKMILAAKNWTTVPERKQCTVGEVDEGLWAMHKMDSDDQLIFTFDGKQCIDEVNYVEHAVVITSYEASFRGAVQVELTSPNGFTSILMRPRFKDNSSAPLLTWPFVSFLHWGEPATGDWKVKFSYDDSLRPSYIQSNKFKAEVTNIKLVLYGTKSRHVNPSKSSPALAELKRKQKLEREAIQEQFEFDKKTNNIIGETIDRGSIMKRGGQQPLKRDGVMMSRRQFSHPMIQLARDTPRYGWGSAEDFQDPWSIRPPQFEFSPRLNEERRKLIRDARTRKYRRENTMN
ncbi:neuroendocrine convertase 2-like [Convolutriloba macropyga]|uniref:neuroendocrine convertase 2-like n=1 Tax=Convolutriloba macropyga TaxID=536237 RepID=UPI003F521BDB